MKAKAVIHDEKELRRKLQELKQDLARLDDIERRYGGRNALEDEISKVDYLLNGR